MTHLHINKGLYGKIDRVPGLFYVATMFDAMNGIPVFPRTGYLVREGTENGENFEGLPLPQQWKSVFVSYVSAVLVGLLLVGMLVFAMTGTIVLLPNAPNGQGAFIAMAMAAILFGLYWIAAYWSRWYVVYLRIALITFSVMFALVLAWAGNNGVAGRPARPDLVVVSTVALAVLNFAALAICWMHRFRLASYERAQELANCLEIPLVAIDLRYGRGGFAALKLPGDPPVWNGLTGNR